MEKAIRNKKEKFSKERADIIDRICQILGIEIGVEGKNEIILYELQRDEEKLENIRNLQNEVKLYYCVSNWGFYRLGFSHDKNKEISLIKRIFKDDNYKVKSNYKLIKDLEGKTIKTVEYKIYDKEDKVNEKNKN